MQSHHETIKSRLVKVREKMKMENIDIFGVFTGDYHMSEYPGAYFSDREYLSGFTGSAGTLVIRQEEAVLFTDGRYFVQAEKQLSGSGIKLMKSGSEGALTLAEYIDRVMKTGETLGFDGRTCDTQTGVEFKGIVAEKSGFLRADFTPVLEIWEDRPEFPMSEAYELDEKYAGESRVDKIERVRAKLRENKADCHVITSLDDICWLLNIRGADVQCNPVIMAYVMITENNVVLYTQRERFSEQLKRKLDSDGVEIRPYDDVYKDIEELKECSLWIDVKRINYSLYESIPQSVKKIELENPSVLMKAIKNETELKNLRDIHVYDGLAVTRFMYRLKKMMREYGKAQSEKAVESVITEASAAEYLDGLRSEIKGYKDLSFETISAYNANAAMMHYHAKKDNCAKLEPAGMLLVDSGGQYLYGTTDVTRTFALGDVTPQMKKHFTLTLKGMLKLTDAHFLKGCTGYNLDILAREPLWEQGLDYRCGTGHGIGYFLNVHESPNGFRWKHNPGKNDLCVLCEGMVTSNEPGVYIEGKYGIRIENEIVCVKDYENEYGTFLKFETLTMVPIDLDLVDTDYLTGQDIERLNSYHRTVYEKLSPFMQGEELEFLKQYTKAVGI